jgi:Zn-finger nucleic acid-binding protein
MILEFEGVEADFCDDCGGVWLDTDELALLFGDRRMAEDFLQGEVPEHIEKDRRLKCPVSDKAMLKGRTRGPAPVTYDYSARGMWLDRGELEAILRHGSPDPGGERVLGWLRGMFSAP